MSKVTAKDSSPPNKMVDGSSFNSSNAAGGNGSSKPIIPKIKLSTTGALLTPAASSTNSTSSSSPNNDFHTSSGLTNAGAKLKNDSGSSVFNSSTTASIDNNGASEGAVKPTFNGKIRIKIGHASSAVTSNNSQDINSKSSSSAGVKRSADSDDTAGKSYPFAFAGKPTYSPSRVEPSGPVPEKGKGKNYKCFTNSLKL